MKIFATPEFWVAVSFFGFVAILFYYKVPAQIGKLLDQRALQIRAELDDARKLREEAQALLADYKQRQQEANEEADKIISQAKRDAEILAEETQVKMRETLKRRTAQAEDKIAQAEAQAVSEVRAAAVELAARATRKILTDKVDASMSDKLIDASISDLKTKLN